MEPEALTLPSPRGRGGEADRLWDMAAAKKKSKVAVKKAGAGSAEGLSFEEGMERVEEIIEQIESGEIGLEASIEAFEKASGLLARCEEVLERAKQRVIELTPDGASAKKGRGSG